MKVTFWIGCTIGGMAVGSACAWRHRPLLLPLTVYASATGCWSVASNVESRSLSIFLILLGCYLWWVTGVLLWSPRPQE